jgi:hypothetical protein
MKLPRIVMFSGLGFMVLGWILGYGFPSLAIGYLPMGVYIVGISFFVLISGLFATLITERQKKSMPRS